MDLEYLRRRRDEERARAASAEGDAARKAHDELADFFDREARRLTARNDDLQASRVGEQQAQTSI